jgi:hypothetical protein
MVAGKRTVFSAAGSVYHTFVKVCYGLKCATASFKTLTKVRYNNNIIAFFTPNFTFKISIDVDLMCLVPRGSVARNDRGSCPHWHHQAGRATGWVQPRSESTLKILEASRLSESTTDWQPVLRTTNFIKNSTFRPVSVLFRRST